MNKQIIALIGSLVLFSSVVLPQTSTMKIINSLGNEVLSGSNLASVSSSSLTKIIYSDSLFVQNVSDEIINIKVRKINSTEIVGSFNVFNALGQSIPANASITPNYWELQPGETTPLEAFLKGAYYPQSFVGTSTVIYSFLSVDEDNNILDSVFVNYSFSNTSVAPITQSGEYLYNREILLECDPDIVHEYPINLYNHSLIDVDYRVHKTNVHLDVGQESFFKFGEVEYTPSDNNSNASGVFIQANTTLEGTNCFIAKFNGNGIDNNEFFPTVQYKFFNRMSGNDADFVTLVYNVSGVGFNEIKSFEISSAYPNPASSWFSVDFNLPVFTTANLKVYSHAGQLTAVYPIQNQTNSMNVDIENYASGVYFLSIEIDGKQTGVEKLVVQ